MIGVKAPSHSTWQHQPLSHPSQQKIQTLLGFEISIGDYYPVNPTTARGPDTASIPKTLQWIVHMLKNYENKSNVSLLATFSGRQDQLFHESTFLNDCYRQSDDAIHREMFPLAGRGSAPFDWR